MTTAQAGETKRILFYGDSNTFGWITHADITFDRFPVSYKAMFEDSFEKSAQFAELFAQVAKDNNAEFFDAASVVPFGEADDEIHLNAKNYHDLANALAPKIKAIFKDNTPLAGGTEALSQNTVQDNNNGMIVRISEIEVYPEYLAEYLTFAKEVAEQSVEKEEGVVSIYPMAVAKDNTQIRILEIYKNQEAYQAHIATPHFKKYKEGTLHMVKHLDLVDTCQLCPENFAKIFKKAN